MSTESAKARRKAALAAPARLESNAVRDTSGELTVLLADMFALYLKTEDFHWHVSRAAQVSPSRQTRLSAR